MTKKWSGDVTEHSHALDTEEGIFASDDPKKIARSLKKSAEESKNRKSTPHQAASSMLTFYINRAGKNLPAGQRKVLNQAKDELKKLFEQEK